MMRNKITIYIVGHKAFDIPEECDSIYRPIYVGTGIPYGKSKGFLTDDIGVNISFKNSNYCEMTAYYWIWKNDSSSEIVGISHYRRYFTGQKGILNASDIEKSLVEKSDKKVILPKPIIWKRDSVYLAYLRGSGYKKDLENMIEIIKEKHPEYVSALYKILNGKKASYCNMIICRKRFFDGYCEWLFGILESLEKLTDMTGYTVAEKRVYGYLAEILLNVYCEKNRCQIEEKNIIMLQTDNNLKASMKREKFIKFSKEAVKHIIWFPSGIKPARRKSGV